MNALVFTHGEDNLTVILECHPWLSGFRWDNTTTIHEINNLVRFENIGAIILVIFVFMFGTIGNVPVLFIYGTRFKKSAYRANVLLLSASNLTTSFILMPGCLFFLAKPLTEYPEFICKFGVFCFPFFAIFSGFVLFMIAVERYLIVCRQKGRIITEKYRKYFFITGIFLAALFSWPMFVLFGRMEISTGINGIIANGCNGVRAYSKYLTIINACWAILSFGNTVIMISLYSLVLRRLITNKRNFRHFETLRNSPVRNKMIQTRKSTITLFVVSAVSIVATMPSNVMAVVFNTKKCYDCDLKLETTIILRTVLWLRLISPAINPFLYGFSDCRFRKELCSLIKRKFRLCNIY